jgi:protein-tyrosine phosphatase
VRLLYVCTGNLCRSPYAEIRTRALLGSRADGVEVSSAGTRAEVGAPVDEPTARVLAEKGLSPDEHRARRLVAEHVEGADWVLTMTSDHRSAVLELVPTALRRTFTLAEAMTLATMLEPQQAAGSTADRMAALVPRLAAARARPPRPHPGFPDVVDPIGRSIAVHRQAAAAIDDALDVLLPLLVAGR